MDKERLNHLIDVSTRNLDMYTEIINNAYHAMNNIIFVVSTGAFVLTISFIGYLKVHVYFSWLLLISWICFFFAIVFNFLAHWITARSSDRNKELINEERRTGFPENGDFNKKSNEDVKMKTYRKLAKITNIFVLVFLPLGIISLICFSWKNLNFQNELNIQSSNILKAD